MGSKLVKLLLRLTSMSSRRPRRLAPLTKLVVILRPAGAGLSCQMGRTSIAGFLKNPVKDGIEVIEGGLGCQRIQRLEMIVKLVFLSLRRWPRISAGGLCGAAVDFAPWPDNHRRLNYSSLQCQISLSPTRALGGPTRYRRQKHLF